MSSYRFFARSEETSAAPSSGVCRTDYKCIGVTLNRDAFAQSASKKFNGLLDESCVLSHDSEPTVAVVDVQCV